MHRRFLRLTVFNILANIVVPLAGLVDTAMLGHLPEIRFLAGVALGGILFDFLYWSLGFLRMATTGTTAVAMGRGDTVEGQRILQRSLLVALGLGMTILLGQRLLEHAGFQLLAGAPEVELAGREYFRARVWGAPAVLANLVLMGWFLGREESRLVLLMTLVASITNIVLDYLFIFRLGWAARGAGWATMLSQYLMLATGGFLYALRRDGVGWSLRVLADPSALVTMLGLQRDLLLRTLCLVGSFAVFTNLGALLGTAVLAANTLLLRVLTLAALFIDGVAFATESLAGRLAGEESVDRLRWLLQRALLWAAVCASLFVAFLVLLPEPFFRLLTSHLEVVELASRYTPGLIATLLLGSAAYILDGFFLGLTDGRTLRNAMFLSFGLVFLPLAGIAYQTANPWVLWLSLAGFMLARATTLGWAAHRYLLSKNFTAVRGAAP